MESECDRSTYFVVSFVGNFVEGGRLSGWMKRAD